MELGFTEEQEILRKTARDFLSRECPPRYVREMMEDEIGYSKEVWRKMAELGWIGLIFPESVGGAGLTLVDLAVVLHEMGRVLVPGPFFSTVLLGGIALAEAGSPEQHKRYLRPLVAGELKATLALVEASGRWDAGGVELEARSDAGGYLLTGTKLFVPDAHTADLILVAARTERGRGEEGISLFGVEVPKKGVTITLLPTLDPTRKLCEVVFDKVRVGPEELVGPKGQAWKTISRVLDRAVVGLCAEMCGGAERVLEMAVEYAKVRVQFDRPIGSFQAIQHKCADMLLRVEGAKAATDYAAWAVANDTEDAPLAAATAKAYASEAYRSVAADAIQIHGAIGFTWEHDLHLFFRRAKAAEVLFGDPTYHRERVAQLVAL